MMDAIGAAEVVTDRPFKTSLLDDGAQGLIGAALPRVEGPLKASGRATYAAENRADHMAHGVLVSAAVPSATVTGLDDAAARRVAGVIEVFADPRFLPHPRQAGEQRPSQTCTEVAYAGQPIALVVAETFEAAREAALLVRPRYAVRPAAVAFAGREGEAEKPAPGGSGPPYGDRGDLEQAMREAPVTLDVVYTTPSQGAAAMEPHAALARWDGNRLTLHAGMQLLDTDREQLANAIGVPKEDIRLLAPYVGGGFGAKLFLGPEAVAAALAARALGRPVKVVMTRQQVFEATTRRSDTVQRIRLGATRMGRLLAIGHESVASNLPGQDFFEPCGVATRFLYAAEHRRIRHDLMRTNRTLSGSMRAPGEAAGMLALECAMDEMADRLGLDPIAFRRLNEPEQDPERDVPYSSRALVRCMEEGAARFGWSLRNPRPAQVREGEWLVGVGMAAAARSNRLQPSRARVTLTPRGTVEVETDMTDIGTGSYTILAQIAGELLGLPAERVAVRLGDTDLPTAYGSGGSMGAGSAGTAVYAAAAAVRGRIAARLGYAPTELTLKDGRAVAGNRIIELAELAGEGGISGEGAVKPGENEKAYRQASFGSHFAEVGVNSVTGEVRVRRMLGVFAAGRILNAATARSQCIGGMTFGIGAALSEALLHDPRTGRAVNRDLAEYHVPVNADVPPTLDAVFLEERDPASNPLQSKGIGELGISGAGAAVANAVHNATGVRVRDYPITLDKLLSQLPPA